MKTKKELREEYNQMKFPMGVFQIRNTINQKIFIGSSNNLNAIWNRNRTQLNLGNHPCKELQQDWNKLGEEKFKYEILGEVDHVDTSEVDYNKEIKLLEELFIEELQPFDEKGYHVKCKK